LINKMPTAVPAPGTQIANATFGPTGSAANPVSITKVQPLLLVVSYKIA